MKRSTILVYRIGNLGDTVVALPALWAIRRAHSDSSIVLLTDDPGEGRPSLTLKLLGGTGLYDDAITYRPIRGRPLNYKALLSVFDSCKLRRFEAVYYLAPSARSPFQVARDRCFFRLIGARRLYGFHGQRQPYPRAGDGRLERVGHEADYLLSTLRRDRPEIPAELRGYMDLVLTDRERSSVDAWVAEQAVPTHRTWVGFGPGSNMPAKRWPLERFASVGRALIREHNVFPVVFGGREEAPLGRRLIGLWGEGANAAEALSVREAAESLRRCAVYVGNDTGTMHLAAAVGTPCVAIFSSRENPGRWDPYGEGHMVLRNDIPCEGCLLNECDPDGSPCLLRTSERRVLEACRAALDSRVTRTYIGSASASRAGHAP